MLASPSSDSRSIGPSPLARTEAGGSAIVSSRPETRAKRCAFAHKDGALASGASAPSSNRSQCLIFPSIRPLFSRAVAVHCSHSAEAVQMRNDAHRDKCRSPGTSRMVLPQSIHALRLP